MRGRKPKERDQYVLHVSDEMFVEVTRDVYLEWYRSKRKEKYQKEKNQKYHVCNYDELDSLSDSIVVLKESLEDIAIQNLYREKIREMIAELPMADAKFIYLLFFEEVPEKDIAGLYGCSRRTVQNRRKRILKMLRTKMRKIGIQAGYL